MLVSPKLYPPKLTEDGSYTFFSSEFDECYHSTSGAREEAEKKFIVSSCLAQTAKRQNNLKILDICYGLGYNSAAALETIEQVNPHCQVELVALESDALVPLAAIQENLLKDYREPIPEYLSNFAHNHRLDLPNLQGKLLIGDARETIQTAIATGWQAEAIFLDPFSPTKCPQLWTVEFLTLVAKCLRPTGYLVTYSCAAAVRTALQLAGLQIGATDSVGRRSPGTIASFSGVLTPLSLQEQEHLQTKAAIPYRDPDLHDSIEVILQRRRAEQELSCLEPSSHWKKRWQKA
jgi:tRNA U34 5-methylaminomethyl-2-thiouridine-forming methyltransferase MnmC